MRVLVAEDETIIRLDLRDLLERSGFEVCAEARDGEEAVNLARSSQPDVAIMDVKMPKLDGIEAARRILDERPIPIVMLTAYGQDELVGRAVEAGVFGYLVKPFREQDLLPAIPVDPFDGQPLRYVRRDDGVTVYSIGLDEKDDGGLIPIGKVANDTPQDVGFRLYDLASRGLPALPRTGLPGVFVVGPDGELEVRDDSLGEQGPEPREVGNR